MESVSKNTILGLKIMVKSGLEKIFWNPSMGEDYSIVKDSSADLGVNSKIVQIKPTVKAVSTKISKKIFAYMSIFWYFWEKIKRDNFSILNIEAKTALS